MGLLLSLLNLMSETRVHLPPFNASDLQKAHKFGPGERPPFHGFMWATLGP